MTGTTTTIQLFEDYGPVDSSLFLTAHGFVPHENPNNCATISGASFLRRDGPVVIGRNHKEDADFIRRALISLRFIHPGTLRLVALEDVCVKENLAIVDDEDVGWRPGSDSIAIASLVLGNGDDPTWKRIENAHGGKFAAMRDECISAIRSENVKDIETRCARYPESSRIVREALRTAAKWRIETLGDAVEEVLLSRLRYAESRGRDRLALALRFRIEENKILNRIVHFEYDVNG